MQYMLALTLDDYIVSEYKHEKQLDWLSGINKFFDCKWPILKTKIEF